MKTLSTEEIGKSYGGRQVVKGVSLQIEQGEVVGLLGPNGAGKTTSFYMIVGLVRPDSGRVLADGHDISRLPMYLRARNYGISYLPQEPSVFRKLTVQDNILAVLEAQQLSWESRRTRTERLIEQLNLGHVRKTQGLCAERRRAAAGGDCAMPGDRAGVYSAGRAVFWDRSDCGAGSAGDHLRVEEERDWGADYGPQCAGDACR